MRPESKAEFERVDALFDAALDLEPAARTAMLERLGREDPAAAARLETLLRAAGSAEGFPEGPMRRLESSPAEMTPGNAAGLPLERVGPYRLIREVGRGGMGAVFLAERDDAEFRLRVALKLLPRELGSGPAIRRFRDERRILASLSHPNIARLLDGGVEAGLPWYAMEYVAGIPLDRYADQHGLSVEARLDLFGQVCRAVQYAHQNLIVHRDIKPGNILVDEDATVKLLDFGIAQLTADAADLGDPSAARRMMTPEYASPEQLRGEPVSTASDLYSLGVLLHELLTGRRPVPSGEPAAPARSGDGPRLPPSAALARLPGDEVRTAAHARHSTPERLRGQLRGDLDAIILKALDPAPAGRYATAEQLADDVRRHRNGLPVGAHPDSSGYRTRKFLARHAAGVSIAAGLVCLLGGFAVVIAVQSRRIAEERDKAGRVAGFLVGLFEAPDPYGGRGQEITAREVLDSGAARVGRELTHQPALRADMMAVMAQSYAGLGLYGESRELAESSYVIYRDLLGPDHPDVAGALTLLGQTEAGLGNHAEAVRHFRRTLEIRRPRWGPEHPFVARTMNSLGQALRLEGNYAEAELLLRKALAIDRGATGWDGEDVAQSLRGLAHVLRDRGSYAAAEPLYREAHAVHQARLGDEHPETANSLINLGLILQALGDPARAEPMVRRGLEIKRASFGDDHGDVATDLASLAGILHDLGTDSAAEASYRQAIAVHRAARPDGHPRTAAALLGLGKVLLAKGDRVGAEPPIREALAIRRRSLPAGHPHIAEAERALRALRQAARRSAQSSPCAWRSANPGSCGAGTLPAR